MDWIKKIGHLLFGDYQTMDRIKKIGHLLDYVNNQQVPVDFRKIEKRLGPYGLRIVSIKILNWLRAQNHLKKKRPLRVDMQCPWCVNLSYLLNHDGGLAKVFVISDKSCDFCGDVSETEREAIRALVDKEFQPRLFVSYPIT